MIELRVNGREHRIEVDPEQRLLEVLREELGLTGAKYGCGEGACGACTVLVDGRAVHACMMPVREVTGTAITTIEGLERAGRLHPLQQAFLDVGAMQCGYCTPGMIIAGVALLATTPAPTPEEIDTAMNGNICRCGTYPRIVAAIRRAASQGEKP
jgi:aerobic-type carbon monoxide dehydrogenase small subunit (CoxS/CutS family)